MCGRKSVARMERVKLNGKGTVVSHSVIHDAPARYEMMKPYVLAIVEMGEDCRLTSQIMTSTPRR